MINVDEGEKRVWRSMRDGPWPVVHTGGELERAEAEWLHTNGSGAYAMSTVALMHTRRHHGLFVAPLDPPHERYVILSHADVRVEAEGRVHRLATHQFPGLLPTPGYRQLESFAQDPLPRWIYRLGQSRFERSLCLVRGHNTLVLSFHWYGRRPARLEVRPLLPLRRADELMTEHGGMVQTATMRQNEVEIQPLPQLPPVSFRHDGIFVGSPDWWRRFEYLDDRESRKDFQEDIWTPGNFDLRLEPDKTTYLLVSLGGLPDRDPAELMEETREQLLSSDPGPEHADVVRALWVSADQFCADACEHPVVLAGYPYFGVRTRDALVALPGLTLVRGRVDEAKRVLSTLLAMQRSGLLPEELGGSGTRRARPSPDATLWLFEAARELVARTGTQDEFVRTLLYPALRRAFVRVMSKRHRLIWLSAEGLVANGSEQAAMTWMDAQVDGQPATPRAGLAVEHQALWGRGTETLSALAAALGDDKIARAARFASDAVRAAFPGRFWCNETEYPFDCLSEERDTADAWADPSIRPNAVVALAVDPALFARWQGAAIVRRARDELVTLRGLRTLSARDPNYRGHYEGRADERGGSFHQGTAWPHLFGAFARAALAMSPDDFELREDLRQAILDALDGPVLGQVAQIGDGDEPHRPRGCPAQAWSVAELLRTLVVELEL